MSGNINQRSERGVDIARVNDKIVDAPIVEGWGNQLVEFVKEGGEKKLIDLTKIQRFSSAAVIKLLVANKKAATEGKTLKVVVVENGNPDQVMHHSVPGNTIIIVRGSVSEALASFDK